jgi:hypothetical protein
MLREIVEHTVTKKTKVSVEPPALTYALNTTFVFASDTPSANQNSNQRIRKERVRSKSTSVLLASPFILLLTELQVFLFYQEQDYFGGKGRFRGSVSCGFPKGFETPSR